MKDGLIGGASDGLAYATIPRAAYAAIVAWSLTFFAMMISAGVFG